MTNSTGSSSHSRATVTVGSGTLMTWLGTRSAVASNQNAAIWFSTCPLNGMVPEHDVEGADAIGGDERAPAVPHVAVAHLAFVLLAELGKVGGVQRLVELRAQDLFVDLGHAGVLLGL